MTTPDNTPQLALVPRPAPKPKPPATLPDLPCGHPVRLLDGAWGASILKPDIHVGDAVIVRTRRGKTWTATVRAVLARSRESALCQTQPATPDSEPERPAS